MKRVNITIDGQQVRAEIGTSLLRAALQNDIYIPNLCSLESDSEPEAACRLCFVEIEGRDKPVTACTETVTEGMVVSTRGAAALKLVRTGFELIMASHDLDCAHCPANRNCELQKIAKHLRAPLKPKHYPKLLPGYPVDESHPDYRFEPGKCVLCGRCVRTCRDSVGIGVLGFARRGFKRRVTTFAEAPLGADLDPAFAACVRVCPTGALSFRGETPKK
jgi:bidirectional [NiFe] hydrogenase diaphorase subunit